MKKLLIVPLLFSSILLFSQNKQECVLKTNSNKVENKQTKVEKQKDDIELKNIKEKLELQQKLNEQTINSISIQLDAASHNLTLFGFLFTILGAILGVYVTFVEKKVIKISEENKDMLTESKKIKEEVEEVKDIIEKDIHTLFIKIKREEIDYTLNRLVKAPNEIRDVGLNLISSELQPENFIKIRQAYLNSNTSDVNNEYYWEKLFIRHFIKHTLRDDQLREKFSVYITHIFSSAFDSEIDKITFDFAKILVDDGLFKYKDEINHFFLGLTNSRYKRSKEIIQLLFDNLKSRKNRFDLFDLVQSTKEYRTAKIEFGNLLSDKYSAEKTSNTEALSFEELARLQKEQEENSQRLIL